MSQLSNTVATSIAITVTAGAAGTSDLNSSVVDTANADGVRFVLQMGAIVSGAVTSAKVQQGDASNLSDAADLEGSAQTIADTDDEDVFIFDVRRPTKRYVRLVVDRGTQNATCTAIAELYGVRSQPATQGSGVTVEKLQSPDEGTA